MLLRRPQARKDGQVGVLNCCGISNRCRQISDLTNKVQNYEALLRELIPTLSRQQAQNVEQTLKNNEVGIFSFRCLT